MLVINRMILRLVLPCCVSCVVSINVPGNSEGCVVRVNIGVITVTLNSLFYNTATTELTSITDVNFNAGLHATVCRDVRGFSFSGVSGFDATSLMAQVAASMARVRGVCVVVLQVFFETPLVFTVTLAVDFGVDEAMSGAFLIIVPVVLVFLTLFKPVTMGHFGGMFGVFSKLGTSIRRGLVTVHIMGTFIHRSCRGGGFGGTGSSLVSTSMDTRGVVIVTRPLVVFLVFNALLAVACVDSGLVLENRVRVNGFDALAACIVVVLVSIVVVTVVLMRCIVSETTTTHVTRIVRRGPSVGSSSTRPSLGIGSNSMRFGGIDFGCDSSNGGGIVSKTDFGVGSNRAMNIVNNAKDTGAALMDLVPELCSIANNRILINNRGIGGCGLFRLHRTMDVILRGGILFSNAVVSGLH